MSSTSDICRKVIENMTDGLACAVVDINTGLLMGIHHSVSYFTPDYLDAIAAASVEMFAGRTVKRIEQLMSVMSKTTVQESFEEIFVASPRVFHFMILVREKNAIAILVTRNNISRGMGWASLRNAVPDFIDALS